MCFEFSGCLYKLARVSSITCIRSYVLRVRIKVGSAVKHMVTISHS